MPRTVTPANSVLSRNDIPVKDVATIAELSRTSMALIGAGRWKAGTGVINAVYKTALVKGFTPDKAAAIRDEYTALCDEAWQDRHGKAVVR